MIKNRKLSTVITMAVSVVVAVCILLLFLLSNQNMMTAMRESSMNNMQTSLEAKTEIIDEYVDKAEGLLEGFSKAPVVAKFLKNPEDGELFNEAEDYTLSYFAGLDNWEGLYVGEWNTHVITHSTPEVIGITTREGEALETLQGLLSSAEGAFNLGIMLSPSSQKLVLSLYCPVYDGDGETILGLVGGATYIDELNEKLNSLGAEGMENVRCSMINTNTGIYIVDQDASLLATEVEDPMLLTVIDEVQTGGRTEGSLEYTRQDGKDCIAIYSYMPERGWAVTMSDTKEEIYAKANAGKRSLGMFCILFFLLIAVLSWVVVRLSVKPLAIVESAILSLKDLELNKPETLKKYINRKSEVGQIATAMDSLYDTFKVIVAKLRECMDSLGESAGTMNDASENLVECVTDNSATTQQLAASLGTTNHAIEEVGKEVLKIAGVVNQVEEKIQTGDTKSEALIVSAENIRRLAEDSKLMIGEKIEENRKSIETVLCNPMSLS